MAKQYEFTFHGGKRKNAGRKNRTGLKAHTKRPKVDFKKPLHITLKTTPNLQKMPIYKRMKQACKRTQDFEMNVLQFSMLNDHIHMIVEAKDNQALTSGMKSLTNVFAKRFNKRFKGRYHLQVITSPTQMRNAYRYVLLNFAKHMDLPPHVGPFSSGTTFKHWKDLEKIYSSYPPEEPEDYGLAHPKSWLAAQGWKRGSKFTAS